MCFFIDLSAITSFDVEAFSAVTEVLSHKRDQLKRVVAYTCAAPLGPQARALPARLGNLDYVTSEAEFDDRLVRVGPRGSFVAFRMSDLTVRPPRHVGASRRERR